MLGLHELMQVEVAEWKDASRIRNWPD